MVVHIRRFMIPIIAGILFLSIIVIMSLNVSAGDTITVGPGGPPSYDYDKIQEAIDAANESGGDIIHVYSKTYDENIIIDRPLTLIGEGSGTKSIIGADDGKHTIEITTDDVYISGFTIQNEIGSTNHYSCIFLSSASDCTVTDNIISEGENGLYLVNSNSNTISGNTIEENEQNGLYLLNSDSNVIYDNIIENKGNGIYFYSGSSQNEIYDNTISGHVSYGVSLVSSNSNIFYRNDFSDNGVDNAKDPGTNSWSYSSEGNYWDDYNGVDENPPYGIGDTPYDIPGGGNQDEFPLGYFPQENQKPIATINNPSGSSTITEGDSIYFSGTGDDLDSGDTITAYNWRSSIDGQLSTKSSFSTSSLSVGAHTIYFKVKDNHDAWSSEKTRSVTVQEAGGVNQKPTAYIFTPSGSVTKEYGESIEFRGQGSDDGQVVAYSWRSSIDGVLSSSRQFIKNDLSVGQHTIYFKVKDNDGEWSSEVSVTVKILSSPSNNPPVADAGGPYSGYVNQSITFDGSSSYDPDDGDSITSYQWDFGDGSTGEGVSPQHTYTSEGDYTVELTVKDGHGEQTKSTTSVNVQAEGQNGNGGEDGDKDNGIPGFEIIFVIIAIAFILFYKRKKRK